MVKTSFGLLKGIYLHFSCYSTPEQNLVSQEYFHIPVLILKEILFSENVPNIFYVVLLDFNSC